MSSNQNTKIYVLDTNVILHDFRAIYSFEENGVVIPITLLEEVDRFKVGNEELHFNARQFTRELANIVGDRILKEPAPLPHGGWLRVETDTSNNSTLKDTFYEDTPDHRILAVAFNLAINEFDFERVVLITKDINLRMKAKSVGVRSEDYETGKVKNVDDLFTGKNEYANVDSTTIDDILSGTPIQPDIIDPKRDFKPNEYFILKSERKSALARFDAQFGLVHVSRDYAYGIQPRNAEQTFSLNCLIDPNIKLVSLSGKAGTGKTLMALAAALEVAEQFRRLMVARPIVPLSNKDIGYLPGDVGDKVGPYMQPLYDNLAVIQDQFRPHSKKYEKIQSMLDGDKLMITPLAFIRGRSLSNVFFIIDEAQNLTPHEVKTIITRAGEGSKIVFCGDPYQIDTPYLDVRSNGLSYLIDRMKGQSVYAHVTLEKGERSQLADLASELL